MHAVRTLHLALLLVASDAPIAFAQERAHATPGEKLGTVEFATSCRVSTGPQFDRAIALLHSFEFRAAIAGFNTVLAGDSSCAMAHWGIALSRWGNPFTSSLRPAAQLRLGREAIERADRAATATPRERGYVAAAALLFADHERTDQRLRIVAYERAMGELAARMAAQFDPNAVTSAAPGSAGVFALAAIPARWALERGAWAEAAALEPRRTAFTFADALTYFARALGAARVGNVATARASIDSLREMQERLARAGEGYWAEQVDIARLGGAAWLAYAEHDTGTALALMRTAAAREDRTEKAAITPGPLAPARELLGDMLLQLDRPAEALAAYRETLETEPNRFRTLYGAMRAASLVGDHESAARYAAQLRATCMPGDRPGRPELAALRSRR